MHYTYCGVLKGTSQAEAMLKSEKFKLVVLDVIELCFPGSISRSVSRLVGRSVSQSVR